MKDPKFRVWDKLTSKMSPSFSLFGEFTLIGGVHAWQHEESFALGINDHFDSLGRLNDLEIMQFTGLHDKNGKEIYEGDILSEAGYPFEVIWDVSRAKFRLQWRGKSIQYPEWNRGIEMEIIGNIFEGKHLLS